MDRHSEALINHDFAGKTIYNSTFTNCDLRGASFSRSRLLCVKFIGCNLGNAAFRQANLDNVIFDGGYVHGVDFTLSLLSHTHIHPSAGRPIGLATSLLLEKVSLPTLQESGTLASLVTKSARCDLVAGFLLEGGYDVYAWRNEYTTFKEADAWIKSRRTPTLKALKAVRKSLGLKHEPTRANQSISTTHEI